MSEKPRLIEIRLQYSDGHVIYITENDLKNMEKIVETENTLSRIKTLYDQLKPFLD